MSTFIIKLVSDPAEEVRGRVRHVSSGEEAVFSTAVELLSFFQSMSGVGSGIAGGTDDGAPAAPEAK